ncbi:MAG TPA: Holliday junction resolvase RuvX [Patescibacteria group bacterium]
MSKSIDSSNMAEISQKTDQENSIGTILGMDYGQSKIGLAIADEETRMAFAFDTLKNDNELWKNLKEIAACENVKMIVLGMTAHEKDQKSASEKQRFAARLEKELGAEVVFQEEMFTTKMAQENIKLRGKKNVAATDDQEAARIILQSWLDK